ncbi:hypothetical protein Zm00014a_029071 [Zea mays]|uniref:Uncharacterized protein n=1 Tax=Zea mays TaxID=4577 RepID=A0A3L6EW89_MAIZE|nr:hypothetical protein Zm00014a_029071 [Zea mays]
MERIHREGILSYSKLNSEKIPLP